MSCYAAPWDRIARETVPLLRKDNPHLARLGAITWNRIAPAAPAAGEGLSRSTRGG